VGSNPAGNTNDQHIAELIKTYSDLIVGKWRNLKNSPNNQHTRIVLRANINLPLIAFLQHKNGLPISFILYFHFILAKMGGFGECPNFFCLIMQEKLVSVGGGY
jgi:hypothetical protein